jgi:hypothetical protein
VGAGQPATIVQAVVFFSHRTELMANKKMHCKKKVCYLGYNYSSLSVSFSSYLNKPQLAIQAKGSVQIYLKVLDAGASS